MKSYKLGAPFLDVHCQNRLNAVKADIVHVHSPFIAGQMGLNYGARVGVPIVGTFHSKYYDDFLQVTGVELLAEVGVKHVVNFYERCDEVWAVTESSADTLRGYGYKGEIRVMPNGTDIHPLSEEAYARVCEKLPGETPVLLFAGQINWKKNLRCILEACAKLDAPFTLVLAGQGPHEKEVRKLAEKLGIADRTVFTGHIGDAGVLNALYKRSSLFVFPSLYDTSGLVVREAAAMGTPSVVVRGSSAAECIEDGATGFLCEDDPGDLARVMARALRYPRKLQRVGEAAKKRIPIPWNTLMDDVAARYAEIVREHEKGREKA